VDYSAKFLATPASYDKVTKIILSKEFKRAKHVDGCYTMVLLDKIIDSSI